MHRSPVLPQMLTDELVQLHVPEGGCHSSDGIGRDRGAAASEPHLAQVNPTWFVAERTAKRRGDRSISGPVPLALVPRQTRAGRHDKQPIGGAVSYPPLDLTIHPLRLRGICRSEQDEPP